MNGPGLVLLLSMVVLLLGGGAALLWGYYQQGTTSGRAASELSVVGPPMLAAATVDAIFARLGSPMLGTGKVVELASRQAHIDDAFALGVWWTETNDGAAGVGLADRNPGSVRGSVGYPSAFDGYTIYPSYTAAIQYWFNMLRNNYVNRGLSSVYAIARPYVGTRNYPLWAGKVINLMYSYRGIAPPPPAAPPSPRAKPSAKPTGIPAALLASAARRQTLQGLSQETPRQVAALIKISGSASAPALPRSGELAIVLLGLLSALAITLYSFRFKPKTAHADTLDSQVDLLLATTTEELSIATEGLPAVPQLDFPVLERQTETLALSRRIRLLPSTPGGPGAGPGSESGAVKVATGRPAGLLSRYRENSGPTFSR
jgi:hypothetical protein